MSVVDNNRCEFENSGGGAQSGAGWCQDALSSDDQSIDADFGLVFDGGGGGYYWHLFFRLATASFSNMYRVTHAHDPSGPVGVEQLIYKYTGSWTTLANQTSTNETSGNIKGTVDSANPATIKLYIDDVEQLSATDSDVDTGKYHALYGAFGSAANDGEIIYFDNYCADPI